MWQHKRVISRIRQMVKNSQSSYRITLWQVRTTSFPRNWEKEFGLFWGKWNLLFHCQKTDKATDNIRRFNEFRGKTYNSIINDKSPNSYGMLPVWLLPWRSLTCTQEHESCVSSNNNTKMFKKMSDVHDREGCRRSTNFVSRSFKFDSSTSKVLCLKRLRKWRSWKHYNQGTHSASR